MTYIRGNAGELFPTFSQAQLLGVQALVTYGAGKLPLSWMAYVLATAYHETGKLMQGVKEGFNLSDAWRKKNLRYYPWYGRGLVQLTWEDNYKAASKLVGADLIANPDLALNLDISVKIIVEGMLSGLFTGKALRDYLPNEPARPQYGNARRIINLMDKADLIAGYAIEFAEGLKKGDWR
jgi:Predicted chitinase